MVDLALFYPSGHSGHFEAGHPERPERVEVIRSALKQAGWWEDSLKLDPLVIPEDVLLGVHSPEYLTLLELTCQRNGYLDGDTYTTAQSWELAHASAGGALAVAQAVWSGKARRGFALNRPPGHHASRGQGMGFCLLNNVALAAEYLLRHAGALRLAIVDLDLHHGNGTQDIFYERGDVFYISTHQAPFYPGSGHLDETGIGAGERSTANFPMTPGSGDKAFLTVMEQLILPLLDRYMPEMILVSYGFDAHWSDPLGNLYLTADGYGRLISRLAHWTDEKCKGKLALFLEGGYDLEAAIACTLTVVPALLGKPWHDLLGQVPYPERSGWKLMLERAGLLWGLPVDNDPSSLP